MRLFRSREVAQMLAFRAEPNLGDVSLALLQLTSVEDDTFEAENVIEMALGICGVL